MGEPDFVSPRPEFSPRASELFAPGERRSTDRTDGEARSRKSAEQGPAPITQGYMVHRGHAVITNRGPTLGNNYEGKEDIEISDREGDDGTTGRDPIPLPYI